MIKEKIIDNVLYYSFTDVVRHSKTNITQESFIVPSNHIIKGTKGRGSTTYIDKDGLKIWYSNKRRIKCNKLDLYLRKNIGIDKKIVSSESLFIGILIDFLKEFDNISIKREFNILNYSVDLCINNELVVEFDEYGHFMSQDKISNDKYRQIEIEKLGYNFIRIKSSDPYGKSIHKIYKETKKIL